MKYETTRWTEQHKKITKPIYVVKNKVTIKIADKTLVEHEEHDIF